MTGGRVVRDILLYNILCDRVRPCAYMIHPAGIYRTNRLNKQPNIKYIINNNNNNATPHGDKKRVKEFKREPRSVSQFNTR